MVTEILLIDRERLIGVMPSIGIWKPTAERLLICFSSEEELEEMRGYIYLDNEKLAVIDSNSEFVYKPGTVLDIFGQKYSVISIELAFVERHSRTLVNGTAKYKEGDHTEVKTIHNVYVERLEAKNEAKDEEKKERTIRERKKTEPKKDEKNTEDQGKKETKAKTMGRREVKEDLGSVATETQERKRRSRCKSCGELKGLDGSHTCKTEAPVATKVKRKKG